MATTDIVRDEMTPICNQMRGFIAQQAIFSYDSKLLFLYSAKNIYIHSVETGECICSLIGHESQIVSLIINPANYLQLISLDKYGSIKIWDYLRCKTISTIDLPSILELEKGPLYSSLTGSINQSNTQYIYCIVNNQHIISINTENKTIKPIIYNVARRRDVKGDKESFQNLSISNDGTYLSAIMQREIIIIKLQFENTTNTDLHLISYKTHGWKLSHSLSFHPNNNSLAFGDARGGISLWHDFISLFNNNNNNTSQTINQWLAEFPYLTPTQLKQKSDKKRNKNVKKTGKSKSKSSREQKYLIKKIHWHSHMISCLQFTTDGAYMLSGGEESVLVLTQLETYRQQYLARLGGGITFISVSNDEIKFAVGLNSNKIRIIDSINNTVVKTIEGIGICHKIAPNEIRHYHQRFSYNPRDVHNFVLPSLPGYVQFYDLNGDRSRGVLKLFEYPLISRINEQYPHRYVTEFMQFNQDGSWLITVIKRSTHSILGSMNESHSNTSVHTVSETESLVDLVTLQIWHYNVKKDEFILNTRIDAPHNADLIRGIVFHPIKNRFLSFAYNDNNFKLWNECYVTKYLKPKTLDINDTNSQEKHITWKSWMSAYYDNNEVTAANFSNDGSILFVCSGKSITLWNANNLMLLKKIEQSASVRGMQNFSNLPYLLVNIGDNEIVIWDLIQFDEYWCLKSNEEINIKKIFDVVVIPFKHSRSLFLVACTLQKNDDNDNKYLILCDMQKKEIVHKWLLPKDIEIKQNSMIIEAHNANKRIIKAMDKDGGICDKDIDVIFMTVNGPIRIPCLFTQWKHRKNININNNNNNNDDDNGGDSNVDTVRKYLDKISGKGSVFEKIFGTKQLQSRPISKQEFDRQQQLTQERLSKLTPSEYAKSNVVEDMFCGAPHTLPPIDDIFDQFMAYFIKPNTDNNIDNNMQIEKDKINERRIGNTNIILDEIDVKNEEIKEEEEEEDIIMTNKQENYDEDDDVDSELDENYFDHLRSIIMLDPIDIEYIESSKSNKKIKNETDPNGLLSAFWSLTDGLNDNKMNDWIK